MQNENLEAVKAHGAAHKNPKWKRILELSDDELLKLIGDAKKPINAIGNVWLKYKAGATIAPTAPVEATATDKQSRLLKVWPLGGKVDDDYELENSGTNCGELSYEVHMPESQVRAIVGSMARSKLASSNEGILQLTLAGAKLAYKLQTADK